MDLNCQLLLYLDKRHFLSEMESCCQSYLGELTGKLINKFPPCRFLLEINVMDLLDMLPSLGEFLVKEPLKLQSMCSEILFACLQSMNSDQCTVESAQVAVNLRLKRLPELLSRPNPRHYTGLVTFNGLLLAVSKPVSYVYHTVWSCPEECEGNEVIVQYIPKVPPRCNVCRSILFESSGLRRCGEQVIATFKLNNNMLPKNFIIVEDLIPKLKLGSKYNVNAALVKKATFVLAVEEVGALPAPRTTPIPSEIEELYAACNGSSWQFIYCLASSIGFNVCPLNCFMHLKIGLLLSLTSVKANAITGSAIINVLAAGYDTGYAGRLMEEAAKLADRSVFLGTSNTAVPTALTASSGGVCVMQLPLHSYSQKQVSSILSSLETGVVTTDTARTKLRSAVWAQGMDFKKITLLNVASVFGVVCRGDNGEYNDEIVDFLLQKSVDPETSKDEIDTMRNVASYIDIVAGLDVGLEEGTEELLRSYFLAARRERPRGVAAGSMGALVGTCLSAARLCRRPAAGAEHAALAAWLHAAGAPEPRFAPDEYLQTPADVTTLQKVMNDFKGWLLKFTDIS